jgi:glutaminyl-peptide cyclotransferase
VGDELKIMTCEKRGDMNKRARDEGRVAPVLRSRPAAKGGRDEGRRTGVHRESFFILLLAGAVVTMLCAACTAVAGNWWVKTVAEYPHDTTAFTQGLVVHKGRMYESTGQYGKSSLRMVDIETGKVEKMLSLEDTFFGEGITVFKDRLYQLTWKNNIIIVYDVNTFDVLKTVSYSGEGWGLTHDGAHLILSDGSASLRFLDPETLEVVREVTVHEGDEAVSRLNELEYIKGEIWANVWYQDRIVRISPMDGTVIGWIDLGGISGRTRRGREDVLNGIAFDAESDRLFITGKNWPTLFEIEVMAM